MLRKHETFRFAFLAPALFAIIGWNCGCRRPVSSSLSDLQHSKESAIRVESSAKSEPFSVRMTGHEFQWRIRYPGADGVLDTDDDIVSARNLHLPENREIILELCSDDFAYSLFLPHYDFIDVAMPDSPFIFEFTTDAKGNHRLLGAQMCGYTHPLLIGKLIVQSDDDFQSWLASL